MGIPDSDTIEPFASLLNGEMVDEYVRLLCIRGLNWWFEMRIPEIGVHLAPLAQCQNNDVLPPTRLLFLLETVKASTSTEIFDDLFQTFERENDFDGAVAAACAGAISIWDSGIGFERFDLIKDRLTRYLNNPDRPISCLARAGLLSMKGQIEFLRNADIQGCLSTCRKMMEAAEKYPSPSLKVLSAALQIYPLMWTCRFAEMDALLLNVMPLHDRPEVSLPCNAFFQTSLGMVLGVQGRANDGERMLRRLTDQPSFAFLPPAYQLLGLCNLALVLAFQGKISEVMKLAERALALSVPLGNSFHNSFANYCLGIAFLMLGDYRKALTHANETLTRGKACGSPLPELLAAFLTGQARIELGEPETGLAILTEWIPRWRDSGFFLMAVNGFLEIANIQARKGEIEHARKNYATAKSLLPTGQEMIHFLRPLDFMIHLEKRIYPSVSSSCLWHDAEQKPVKIQTFGGLEMRIGEKTVSDPKWRGVTAKTLLKLLVSLGGVKVAADRLQDLLWPDSDGDIAAKNMKAAVHRLKKAGTTDGDRIVQWLVVKHKTVSLVEDLCHVDALYFENALKIALTNGSDMARLISILDVYQADYLPHDMNRPEIVRHREALRTLFVKGVIKLHDIAKAHGKETVSSPYLEMAIETSPLQEALYERLMALHLREGYPSRALLVFQRARQELQDGLGVEPGPALLSLADGMNARP